ncbi:MAG: hypothetical protein KF773_24150 [Deltaproteobacteria bacterium]|nr:hypothetical protein [Deltaproteobacteria bacterium]
MVQAVKGRPRPRLWWIVLVGAALGAGCPPGPPPQPPQPGTCPGFVGSTLRAEPPTCTPPAQPHNDMPKNGLTAGALAQNRPLLRALAEVPLSKDLFSSEKWQPLLAEPYADDLMKYIASCALDPCDAVELPAATQLSGDAAKAYQAVRGRFPQGFRGELGLCGGRYGAGPRRGEPRMWRDEAPTDDCLERVSSCVLARVNAIGSSVVFSMRGDGIALQPKVPVQTSFREQHGTPIVSFQACSSCTWSDAARRNCDWEPRHVGQCTAGSSVTLRHPRAARIRVCGGIYGCDDPSPAAGPTTMPALPFYSGGLLAQGEGHVKFRCPSNGPTGTGYYSVMLAAGSDGQALAPETDIQLDGRPDPAASYPATEAAVFTYREGSFYGSIFRDAGDPPEKLGERLMLSGDQYACYSSLWNHGAAMLAHRLCADPSADHCFVNPPGPCDLDVETRRAGRCQGAREIAELCGGKAGTTWRQPYTSYVNHPCDLFESRLTCEAALAIHVNR